MAPPLVGSLVMGMRYVFPQQMSEVAFSQRRIHAQPDPRWRVFLLLAGFPPTLCSGMSQTAVYDTCGSATAVALVGWVFRS